MWPFTGNKPEPKQERDYEPVAQDPTTMYDDEGYELTPGLFGGYVRKVDLKPVEEEWPPLFSN